MKLVVDASVALKWLVPEEDSDMADRLLTQNHEIHAPRLMVLEAANALWRKATFQGLMDIQQAEARLESLLSMTMIVWNSDEIVGVDALRIAAALRHPAYDCVYLDLARHIGATLVTADERFMNLVVSTEHEETVMLLSHFA